MMVHKQRTVEATARMAMGPKSTYSKASVPLENHMKVMREATRYLAEEARLACTLEFIVSLITDLDTADLVH